MLQDTVERAAQNVATQLQAALSDVPSIRWVEREQLSLAEAELSLSAFANPGAANGLRLGKWVKADCVIPVLFAVFEETLS